MERMRSRTAPLRREDGRRVRRALRVGGWNAALIAAGLALIAGAGELWLRSTVPFMTSSMPYAFVPGVGLIGKPGAEVRITDGVDFWQVSRFNREGFLDREPPRTAPAAAACHVTVIGDSFVAARQVPIAAKLHVRLEVLAAREPGSLNVTTSAYGRGDTGQISQLAYYDEFARKRAPGLIVLVFVRNDFRGNSPLLTAVLQFRDPDRLPVMTAERTADGALRLRPPNPDYADAELVRRRRHHQRGLYPLRIRRYVRAVTRRAAPWSYFGRWLHIKADGLRPSQELTPSQIAWVDVLRKKHPDEQPLLDAVARDGLSVRRTFAADPLPQPYAAELEYTAFALEQFRQRADRDGASLVILAEHHLRPGEPLFDRMRAIADRLRIPVVSLYDHVVRRGGRIRDARWRHDYHWTPAGHQWAAEALLEHLRRNPDTCARGRIRPRAGCPRAGPPGHVRARTDRSPGGAGWLMAARTRARADGSVRDRRDVPLTTPDTCARGRIRGQAGAAPIGVMPATGS